MRPGGFAKPRPRNAPPGRFCPAGRKARGTGCSNPPLLLLHKIHAKQKEQHPIRCCSWCDREDSNLWPSGSEFCDSPQNTMYIRCFCSLCCVWQTLPGRLLLMLHRSKSWNFSKRLNSSLAVVRQWSDSRQTVVKIEGRTRRKQPKIG